MNKRGQFFLIAAIVIVAIILTLSSIYTKAVTAQEDPRLPALASEIQYEIAQTIDHAILSGRNVDELVQNVTALYAYNNPTKDIIVVYGSSASQYVLYYHNNALFPPSASTLSLAGNTLTLTLPDESPFNLNFSAAHPDAVRVFAIIRTTNANQKTTIIR